MVLTGNKKFEDELNEICRETYRKYENKSYVPDARKVEIAALKQWSDTNTIKTIYMFSLIGSGGSIHRVECSGVIKSDRTVIFDAISMCNSDSTGMERASTGVYYLIEDKDLLEKYPMCLKCKKR